MFFVFKIEKKVITWEWFSFRGLNEFLRGVKIRIVWLLWWDCWYHHQWILKYCFKGTQHQKYVWNLCRTIWHSHQSFLARIVRINFHKLNNRVQIVYSFLLVPIWFARTKSFHWVWQFSILCIEFHFEYIHDSTWLLAIFMRWILSNWSIQHSFEHTLTL